MITFVCFKWQFNNKEYQHLRRLKQFSGKHVNILHRMVSKYYRDRFRFVCITDDEKEISSKVDTFPLWDDYKKLGGCYLRLKIFDRDLNREIADGSDYIVCIDLDAVIVDDITSFLNAHKGRGDLVTWHRPGENNPYCGAIWMMRPGTCSFLWEDFSEQKMKAIKQDTVKPTKNLLLSKGTDQAWINYRLGEDHDASVKSFGSGLYDYKRLNSEDVLPNDAKIVFFNGRRYMPENFKHLKWVKDNYNG